MNPYVILTCENGSERPASDRRVVADIEGGDAWVVICGPLIEEAEALGRARWLDALHPGEAHVCMAPVSWLLGELPEVAHKLTLIRDGALDAARLALDERAGARLH